MPHALKLPAVWVPANTPFDAQGAPDAAAFLAHCKVLLDEGADGLAVFGTTSEANSLGLDERMALLEALVAGGIDPKRLMPGTGCCAIPDTVRLTRQAVKLGCAGVLMLPPFYYKGVSDDGVVDAFSRVIDEVAEEALKVFAYHIPPVAQVPVSLAALERLVAAYPKQVVGLKDSSGDWENTRAVIDAMPHLATFSGSEVFLLQNIRAGGAGCISATANVNVAGMRRVIDNEDGPQAEALQAEITTVRKAFEAVPMIPGLKAFLARKYGNPDWARPRPPLRPLDDALADGLVAVLGAIGFPVP